MKQFTYIVIGLLLANLAFSSCNHIFLSKEEIEWFNSWDGVDTLFYQGCDSADIDTVIVTEFVLLSPRTANSLSINPNQWNIGNDHAVAFIELVLIHQGKHEDIQLSLNAFDEEDHPLTLYLCRMFCVMRNFEKLSADSTVLTLQYGGFKNENWTENKMGFDYFKLSKDSALVSYSVNGCIYNLIH